MLTRSAQGLYWIGRYLKRVEHISRLMELQMNALVDCTWDQIHFGWLRLFNHLKTAPQNEELINWKQHGDTWGLTDSFALADELSFSLDNKSSIRSCFTMGRENARQMRHCISSEMWICLNNAYFEIRDLTIEDIWTKDPMQFYANCVQEVNTFMGVCAATLYRDERWEFLQIGRLIEHAQLMLALMLFQKKSADDAEFQDLEHYDWWSLLHCFQADEAYQHYFGAKIQPDRVMNMLVADRLLPNSIDFSLSQIADRLTELGVAPANRSGAMANRFIGRLVALVRYEWPDADNETRMLTLAESLAVKLHDHIAAAWFNYEVDDSVRI